MRLLAEWLVRPNNARAVVLGTLVFFVLAAVLAARVPHDDDVLAFLPKADPDVAAFYEINSKFGGLRVALVGVGAEDVLSPEFFPRLQAATKALDDSKTIDFALSLANVDDFVLSPDGGIETDLLVREIPAGEAERAALRAKVLSRDLVVGNLVSSKLDAALIIVFPAEGATPREFAEEVHRLTTASLGPDLHFGGAPFVSNYVYEATQADLSKLTPWAVAAIVFLILLGFRDVVGSVVVLLATAVGIAGSMALMFVLGVRHNIVLSSMPVIAFSVGSAYGLHVLARYQQLARNRPIEVALPDTMVEVGPTVIAAGLTTVCGLLSFLAMDIAPVRTFGLFTGLGVFFALVLSLTFVPAAIRVFNLSHPRGEDHAFRPLVALVAAIHKHRIAALAFVVAVGAAGSLYVSRVDTRMDLAAFFDDESPPARADRFLLERFGGSQYVQVHVRGDFEDPNVLWQLTHLADRIERLDGVTSVQHAGQVVAQLNRAMEGVRRIPQTADQARLLYGFLTGRPAVDQLVTKSRDEALLQVKLTKSDLDSVEAALATIEKIGAEPLNASPKAIATTRILAAAGADVDLSAAFAAEVPKPSPEAVASRITKFLTSDESLVELDEAVASRIAKAVTEGGDRAAVLAAIGEDLVEGEPADETLADDLLASIATPKREAAQALSSAARLEKIRALLPKDAGGQRFDELALGVIPLLDVESLTPEKAPVATVSGLPVLHRGLSRSTVKNQINSLVLAMISVVLVLCVAFRSVSRGLAAATPTVLTLLVVYGGMGWFHVHLDIGTAMLASLVIGAGVDYAVHFATAWWREGSIATAVQKTGAAIWTNATMVAAGFFILTLGEAKTLQNVGHLTAAAMITAAIATFVCVPIFARREERT